MNEDNSLDLLDLDDAESMDSLPEAPALAAPRPKKPWLLLTVGLAVIVLASYVIIRAIGTESSSSVEIDLDAPVMMVDEQGKPIDMNVMPPVKPAAPVQQPVVQPVQQTAPAAQPKLAVQSEPVVQSAPVRVIEDRKEVKFEPANVAEPTPVAKPAAKPVSKPVVKTQPKPVAKKKAVTSVFSWYVQFGSYSTRALAESAQRKLASSHAGLFSGKQFVILAAQLKNGTTTYRLRVGFNSSGDANGFCRNAKADGLDCYVTK